MLLQPVCICFALAGLAGLAIVWVARFFFGRYGFLDRPDGRLKRHACPVPIVGLALWVSIPITLLLGCIFDRSVTDALAVRRDWLVAIALGVGTLALVGFIDDVWSLTAQQKLIGQLLAAVVTTLACDLRVPALAAFGGTVPLGWLGWPVPVLWLLFVVNALNLLDGMDGMAGTVAGLQLLGLATVAALSGNGLVALVAAATAGGLIGFLRFNLPRATAYLGDCGSLPLGLLIGVLTLEAFRVGDTLSVVPAVVLLSLPAFDTAVAVLRRGLRGQPVMRGDAEHLHHVLRRSGGSVSWALWWTAGCGGTVAVAAVAGAVAHADVLALTAAGVVAVALFLVGGFGQIELGLLLTRLWYRCPPPTLAATKPAFVRGNP